MISLVCMIAGHGLKKSEWHCCQKTLGKKAKSPGHASEGQLAANELSLVQHDRRGVETGLTILGWPWR